MCAVINYECVICYWCIYADLLTKKVNKKCSAPNKLLLLSLLLFCEAPFAVSWVAF